MKDIPIIRVDTDGMKPGVTVVELNEDTPMFDLALRLVWDFFAIVGLVSVLIGLAFWLGWERYHDLVQQKAGAATSDCGSRYCKDKEGGK